MWLNEPHYCSPPLDEISTDVQSTQYWLCTLCGNQFSVTVGEYGARWKTPDGRSSWAVSYRLIKNSR